VYFSPRRLHVFRASHSFVFEQRGIKASFWCIGDEKKKCNRDENGEKFEMWDAMYLGKRENANANAKKDLHYRSWQCS
jgi:hypothetical protein